MTSPRLRLPVRTVYLVSALFHGALWLGVRSAPRPEPPPPPPIVITVRDLPPEPPPPLEPEPDPEPPPPDPIAEPAPAPEAPPPPQPPPQSPVPKARKSQPAPAPAAAAPPAAEVPEFGLELGNSGGPGGLAVPAGDPGGAPGRAGERERVATKTRKLAPPSKQPAGGECGEPEIKPRPLDLPQPQYTDAARAAGIEGKVRIKLSVKADGEVAGVDILASLDPGLDEAARRAALAARFAPATRCGLAVAATITISIKFSL